MSVLPFRAVDFELHEPITRTELDQLQSNYQWIHDNTPRGRFHRGGNGNPLDVRTVIITGRVHIPQNNKAANASAGVTFGKAFAPECRPHVATSIVCDFSKRVHCTVTGPGDNFVPTSSGFRVKVDISEPNEKKDKIASAFWIHWSAFGYRLDNMNEF